MSVKRERNSGWSVDRVRSLAAIGFAVATAMLISIFLLNKSDAEPTTTQQGGVTQLVMLEEDGCPWCERWNEEIGVVYAKTREGKIAPLRRVDIHGKLPADLAFMKTGNFTPTFVLVTGGREVGRIRGYPGEDFFWSFLRQLFDRMAAGKKPPQAVN